jgi:hypothetical protein
MYAAIERVYGPEGRDGEALLERVAARKPSPVRQKDQRRLERQRAEMTRGDALARLLTRGTIDKQMYAAGLHLRGLAHAAWAGTPAIDFTRERVSGGPARRDEVNVAMLDAEGELRRLLLASQMGAEAADVVLRVCALDMLLTPIAVDAEEDAAARLGGGCRKETLALVRVRLRDGLRAVARLRERRSGRGDVAAGVRAWLGEGARPVDAVTGVRGDLPTGG